MCSFCGTLAVTDQITPCWHVAGTELARFAAAKLRQLLRAELRAQRGTLLLGLLKKRCLNGALL